MRTKTLALACALQLFACAAALAQPVIKADVTTHQPTVGRDADGFTSCGVRSLVMVLKGHDVDIYDFSVSIYKEFSGLFKAGKSQSSVKSMQAGQPPKSAVMPPPINFWLAKETEGKALRAIKLFPAETPGYILGISDFAQTADAILSIVEGERMQFAVRYKSEPTDLVVSFGMAMPSDEQAPLLACIEGLMNRMKEGLPRESSPPQGE